jgi:hypothetical protein
LGGFLVFSGEGADIRGVRFTNTPEPSMNAHVKSYLIFVAYMAVTKIVVAPVVKQLNIPVISDVLA